MYPVLLQRMATECSTEQELLAYQVPCICWALGEYPSDDALPAGYTLRLADAAWMNEQMLTSRWENALGEPGSQGREYRNQFALVLSDATGELAAIAGVFLSYGAHGIGVDVVRQHRGEGLAPAVVRAACREILSRGGTPLYGCAATNIRSQRTAVASGFLPAYSDAAVGILRP